MSGEASNAVFISYRREVGGILAMALYQHLTERGIDAFYDIESIRAGQFDTIILNQIAARPYFLLVLTPGTLERTSDPSDWLRREIEHALTTRRVIVPVDTPNFDFGDVERLLPDGLGRQVQRFNGQELPQRWFKFAAQQLVEEFLVPIEIETVAPSPEEQAVVERLRQEAEAAPAVTELDLSAHEYVESAWARYFKGDLDGAIADFSEALRLDPQNAAAFTWRGPSDRTRAIWRGRSLTTMRHFASTPKSRRRSITEDLHARPRAIWRARSPTSLRHFASTPEARSCSSTIEDGHARPRAIWRARSPTTMRRFASTPKRTCSPAGELPADARVI
jgi:TIR domain/TPR repeat